MYDFGFSRRFVLVRVWYLSSSEAYTNNWDLVGKENYLTFDWWKHILKILSPWFYCGTFCLDHDSIVIFFALVLVIIIQLNVARMWIQCKADNIIYKETIKQYPRVSYVYLVVRVSLLPWFIKCIYNWNKHFQNNTIVMLS